MQQLRLFAGQTCQHLFQGNQVPACFIRLPRKRRLGPCDGIENLGECQSKSGEETCDSDW